MSKSPGFSVRIFIPSGELEALRIVEKSNWTGQGLVFPRAQFAEFRQRHELKRTGVYVLWGPGGVGVATAGSASGDRAIYRAGVAR